MSVEKPLRVGIDCRFWNETGIGRYMRNIVKNLARLDTTTHYYIFLLPKDIDSVDLPENFTKVPVDIRWHSFSEQLILPWVYLKYRLNVLWVPHFNVPILYPRRFLATIHDLTILRVRTGRATTLPYWLYMLKRGAFRLNLLSTVLRAHTLFTVSEYVKNDLVKTFKVNPAKIFLTPCAVDDVFLKDSKFAVDSVLAKYGISKPYLFYVGNAHPHKNVESLIKAFERLAPKHSNLQLVLGGNRGFFYERLAQEFKNSPVFKRIHFIGFVADEDLPVLYKESSLFVNPSLYEGFGIQIIEALASGAKVACSNTTSLPEVGGNAVSYFDPRDIDSMVRTLQNALAQPRDASIAMSQVSKFSWADSAKTVLSRLQEALRNYD